MYLKGLALAALASTALAQGSGSLVSVLQGQSDLSNLTALVGANQQLANQLNGLRNITVLAPNNAAIAALMNSSLASQLTSDPMLLQAVLSYHVLNGTYPSISNTSFVHTALQSQMYTNVTGGQVVEATANNGNVTFFSGLLQNSSVVSASPLNFTGGVIHVIDSVLTLPQNLSSTAVAFNLTSAAGALTQANLVNTLDTARNITAFVPNNDAFQAIGSALPNLTMEQVTSILGYHVVEGQVLYSTMLMNGTMVNTTQGTNLTVYLEDNNVYVNSARVVIPNVLIANGVVHVIDEVLNPMNATAMPNTSTTAPAFPGASSATDVPYTSGVPTPTSTIMTSEAAGGQASATGGGSSSSSSSSGGAWMPAATGAIGQAALFGGAALVLNL